MNCGRSSSVEWKLPKLQRRVRFPSPAPPPPGYAPGGFVMPPRQARLASHALFYLPLAPLTQPCGRAPGTKLPQHAALAGRTGTKLSQLTAQRATPVQNSPSSQPSGRHRYKTLPAPPKWPISARFTPAGRTLYRSHHQQVEQGEKSPAPTPHLTHQRAPPTISHAILLHEWSSPVEWCNRFVSFGVGYALSWSGGSSCWVGCGVSRDLVRMSRLR